MTLSDRYRRLATLIDTLEAQGLTVRSASPADEPSTAEPADSEVSVHLELELPSETVLDQFSGAPRSARADDPARAPGDGDAPPETDDGHDHAPDDPTAVNDRDAADASGDDVRATEADDGDVTTADAEPGAGSTGADSPAGTGDAIETDDAGDAGDDPAASDEPAADAAADGVGCTHPDCERTFETERGMKIHRTKAHSLAELIDGGADEALHCDPDVLAEVYEEYETFAEMTEALDVDVGPQAVRKQMIRHGIHSPGGPTASVAVSPSNASGNGTVDDVGADADADESAPADDPATEDAESQESTVSADGGSSAAAANGVAETLPSNPGNGGDAEARTNGTDSTPADADADDAAGENADAETVDEQLPDLDLPDPLSVDDLLTAVEDATTLYDVQRALDLDRDTARDILKEYDLLDLVCGRAATVSEREELKAEIHERLQRAAT
jgi:hypothetical protein